MRGTGAMPGALDWESGDASQGSRALPGEL